MEFFTYNYEKRPVRLKEETRQFAYDSLNHKYGKDTRKTPAVSLDTMPGIEEMSRIQKYDIAISEICKNAPIRIADGEMLSGSATLGNAIDHVVPATYKGENIERSVSHLTVDFETVLKIGMIGISKKIDERFSDPELTDEQKAFLMSAKNTVESFKLWHKRYLDELKDREEYKDNYQNLLNVPMNPANSFYEAVQTIWFCFAFLRLTGNWPGIGRLDVLLGDYLKKDLESGKITIKKAREILAHFFIKGCEWITGDDTRSGDAQHYQNIVLAGIDENGNEVANEVTYLVLDILEELNIGDFPTTVRLNRNSPEKLLRRIAEVMKHGGGVLAIYNEEVVIDAMTNVGYSLSEARRFANDGCWEMQVPGKTNFIYAAMDALSVLLIDTLNLNGTPNHFDSIEELKETFFEKLKIRQDVLYDLLFNSDGSPKKDECPATTVSLFEEGCIKNAADYNMAGTTYFVRGSHLGLIADVGNSLRAIDKLCFIDKIMSFDSFMEILKNNWEGEEALRQYVLNEISYYGNDDDEADSYTKEIADRFADMIFEYKTQKNSFFVPGISTFGRQIEWSENHTATPHGYKKGAVLAPNMSATPGSDVSGATALIKSYCKIDLRKQTSGAALDLKLLPNSVKGEEGTDALVSLMKGFVLLGGCFIQPDIVDNSVLLDAQKHPENYASLSIRVSGWNARFVTLSKSWQDMCIEKTTHGEM